MLITAELGYKKLACPYSCFPHTQIQRLYSLSVYGPMGKAEKENKVLGLFWVQYLCASCSRVRVAEETYWAYVQVVYSWCQISKVRGHCWFCRPYPDNVPGINGNIFILFYTVISPLPDIELWSTRLFSGFT